MRTGTPSPRPVAQAFPGVQRIAVLNGGGIGDLICVLPAIDALAATYPHARITLLGTPVHAQLIAGRRSAPHHVEVLPHYPGVRESGDDDAAAVDDFFDRMQKQEFDLAVQVHGGGRNSNPFLLRLHARHTIGTRTPDAAALERWIPYTYYQHEALRALEVVELAGALPVTLEPRIEPTAYERNAALSVIDQTAERLIVVHPGATDPRRRWPAEQFADVCARAATDGAQVIVVGDDTDSETAAQIVDRARSALTRPAASRVASLAGKVSLAELIGLFARADVVLGNDSGPRHLAQAVGAPTVGIYWFGNLVNAGPLSRTRHRVHLSWTTHCPVCHMDCTKVGWGAKRCEHNESFVADVSADSVYDDVAELAAAGQGQDSSSSWQMTSSRTSHDSG